MNKEEIMKLSLDELEARKAEIYKLATENAEGTDFTALNEELDLIAERKAALIEEQRVEDIQNVIEERNTIDTDIKVEETQMKTLQEVRSSAEYVNAFAEYVKNNNDKEVRALLTELAPEDGTVPVPTFIDDMVRTAWEKEGLMRLVKKSYMKGIVKVGFEKSATGAAIHAEGAKEPDEEELVLGVVELKPESIKKWITISDELYDLKGEAFLRYIYDELTYQIAKKAADTLIGLIIDAPSTATTSAVGVPVVEATQIALDTVAQAIAQLSDEATTPVIVMNKATYAIFKSVQYAGNYAVDPFEGCEVIFNNSMTAFSDATTDDCYMIVGDFGLGAQANFPNGEDIKITFDDLSLAEKDLIKIVGRQYVAMNLVADKAFVKVVVGE